MVQTISDKPPEPVERSTSGLRNVLFDEIDRLRSGIASPSESNALATLVHKIGATIQLEMKIVQFGKEQGLQRIKSLPTQSIALNGAASSPEAPEAK